MLSPSFTSATDEITLTLNRQELDQLLEGLSERAENWEEITESSRSCCGGFPSNETSPQTIQAPAIDP